MDQQFYDELNANASVTGSPFTKATQFGVDGARYDIFSYRIGSFSDFLVSPNARWSRGAMFRVNGPDAELVSLPMQKFWNQDEALQNQIAGDEVDVVMEKLDGSLISTYLDVTGQLRCKSKASLHSEHAVSALELLNTSEFADLRAFCLQAERDGFTVNMEWTSPRNLIVVPYQEEMLTVLNVTHRASRTTSLWGDPVWPTVQLPARYAVKTHSLTANSAEELKAIVDLWKGVEGVVVRMKSGEFRKMKALDYVAMHRYFGKVTTLVQGVEMVLAEVADDLRAVYKDNESAIRILDAAEKFVHDKRKHVETTVAQYMKENAELTIKDYAIKAQQLFKDRMFGFIMAARRGKEVMTMDRYILELAKAQDVADYPIIWVDGKKKDRVMIVDVDGTIAKMGDRSPYEWTKVDNDLPHQDVIDMVQYAAVGFDADVIVVTGRDGVCRDLTVEWCKKHMHGFAGLVSRDRGDCRSDAVIKEEIFRRCIQSNWKEVVCVWDDRSRVVQKWRELGIRCFQVAAGDF